mgnify:CR=1 FL=1
MAHSMMHSIGSAVSRFLECRREVSARPAKTLSCRTTSRIREVRWKARTSVGARALHPTGCRPGWAASSFARRSRRFPACHGQDSVIATPISSPPTEGRRPMLPPRHRILAGALAIGLGANAQRVFLALAAQLTRESAEALLHAGVHATFDVGRQTDFLHARVRSEEHTSELQSH